MSAPRWPAKLAFRDALRADPQLTQRDGALKHAVAVRHTPDREAYTAGKSDFIRAVLDRRNQDSRPPTA